MTFTRDPAQWNQRRRRSIRSLNPASRACDDEDVKTKAADTRTAARTARIDVHHIVFAGSREMRNRVRYHMCGQWKRGVAVQQPSAD